LTVSNQGLDLQVLLEGFEEDFHLPVILINSGYGGGPKLKMVGEKNDHPLAC